MADREIVLARAAPFSLGTLRIEPATREVIGKDFRERLEPRIMQVLVALAGAGGAIVTREDLIEACWGGRIVGDDAINRAIGRIRRVAEGGGGAFKVETINKVGYRLLRPNGPAAGAVSVEGPRIGRRGLMVGGAAAAAFALGGSAWWMAPRGAAGGAELSLEARSLVERGVEASRLGNAESTAQAVGFLEEAVRLAPGSARAWGALALAHGAGQHFLHDGAAGEALRRSQAAAARALELDPEEAGGHAARALALPTYGNWHAAEQAMRRVLAIDPMQFESRLSLARLLANVGRTGAAVAMLEPLARAAELQPIVQYFLAFLCWQAGRTSESDRLLERAVTRWPRNYAVWFTRFWQLAHSGRADRALAMAAQAAQRPIGIPEWNFELIETSARALMTRAPADAAAAVAANVEAARRGAGFAENAIEVAAALGAVGRTYEVAQAYYFGRGFQVAGSRYSAQQGSFTRPARRETKLLFSPSTEAMRRDSRFAPLVREIGLADYWRTSGVGADALGA
ncbi:MAG TPA: winged helix-turn-helix domain-containing protein [Allosphingosinicella sp.]|jgi:tetratricopeptide (TPR) repeat protein